MYVEKRTLLWCECADYLVACVIAIIAIIGASILTERCFFDVYIHCIYKYTCMNMYVCEREREKERESACVCERESMCARVRARLCDININIRIHIFLCHVPLHSFKNDAAVVCEHYHILVCIDMYAYNSLSVHMQPLKCDPATMVNMIMDSSALICMPTILSLYVCSLLKCDLATVDEHNHGLV